MAITIESRPLQVPYEDDGGGVRRSQPAPALVAAARDAWLESKWLLDPAVEERILFGRLVKRRACFDLMVEGARAIAPALVLVARNAKAMGDRWEGARSWRTVALGSRHSAS